LLAAAKSAITHWTENSSSRRRILKIDIPSVIDVNKSKHKHKPVGKTDLEAKI